MSGHGRIPGCPVSRSGLAAGTPPRQESRRDDDPAAEAFRNFGYPGLAPADKTYRGLDAPEATQTMFGKLMLRMAETYQYADGATSDHGRNDNPRIPAGYTYLAQFAAHDIISNTSALDDLAAPEVGRANRRRRPLHLDVLYGEGPVLGSPVYEMARPGEGYRTTLRTGPVDRSDFTDIPPGKTFHAFRDIPRFQQSDLSDGAHEGRPDALIPDLRNDDNAMVAQITALFHHVHNAVVADLRKLGAEMPTFKREGPKGLILFQNARRVVTTLYRRILRHDLLRRLLADPVRKAYERKGFWPLVDVRGSALPLEFTHAAFRLGHAMVRLGYKFNADSETQGIRDALRNTSAARPRKFPVSRIWVADWSRFFDIRTEPPPQASRRIGPSYNSILLEEALFPNELVPGSAQGPSKWHAGLLFSDLIRGTVGGLLSVPALIDQMRGAGLDGGVLPDPDGMKAHLRHWLETGQQQFDPQERDHLSANPPLLLWLLIEAATQTDGLSLGTMGSVIVGDVFASCLAASEAEYEGHAETEVLMNLLFPGGPPSDMPALILYAARALALDNAVPTFAS